MSLPKTSVGDYIWRPVIMHLMDGLTPVHFDLRPDVRVRDDILTVNPLRGFATWGDVAELGAPPVGDGWRFHPTGPTGTPLLYDGQIPSDWTFFEVTRLTRKTIARRSRICAHVYPRTGSIWPLFQRIEDWFKTSVMPTLPEAEAVEQYRRIFDAEKWEEQWEALRTLDT